MKPSKEEYTEFVARLRAGYRIYIYDRGMAFWFAQNGFKSKHGFLLFEDWEAFTEYKKSLNEPEQRTTPPEYDYLKQKQQPAKLPDRIRQVFTQHRKQ
jgi:hypothetical protein